MPRPFTRAQAAQNAAFLRHLRQTGNARASAKAAGVAISTLGLRRRTHPAFAAKWQVACVEAAARLNGRVALPKGNGDTRRTEGGELVAMRGKNGRLQMRASLPGRLTRHGEQAFLLALSATANVRLSAAAVGVTFGALYRRRERDPAFAREMQAALAQGYEAVEMALLAGWMPNSHENDAWRHNEPPAVPAMTANQALQLLYLHQKRVQLGQGAMKQRRGEPGDVHSARLARRYVAQLAEEAEHALLQQVLVNEAGRHIRHDTPPIPPLPALDQVTGWSRADQNRMHADASRALFGGWRMKDMSAEDKARGKEARARRARARRASKA